MTIDEFRNALRSLLNDAVRSGINIDDVLAAAEEELHPEPDWDQLLEPPSAGNQSGA